MRQLHIGLARADQLFTGWVAEHGVTVLRISVGIIFFWFGVLKFFPTLSPAEDLAARTIAAFRSHAFDRCACSIPETVARSCGGGRSRRTRGSRAG